MKGNLYFGAILICIYVVKAREDTTTHVHTTRDTPETTTPETTTPAPITTSAPTPSTPSPEPKPPAPTEGNWNVTDGNITCIRAEMKFRFKIPVENTTEYLLFPNATLDGSTCELSNTTQLLSLSSERNVFMILFEKESGSVYARNISLAVRYPERLETFTTYGKFFSVKEGSSYMCKSTSNIQLEKATLEIFHIQIQAFGVPEGNFGAVEECEADDTINDAIPIAVACALAALIIIVLIAYLVGRRRSRQKGYNSV